MAYRYVGRAIFLSPTGCTSADPRMPPKLARYILLEALRDIGARIATRLLDDMHTAERERDDVFSRKTHARRAAVNAATFCGDIGGTVRHASNIQPPR